LAKRNGPEVRRWRALTARETQVLEYASHGHAHKVIAYELGISSATVGGHLASAAAKVGARSRIELVAAYRAARQPPSASGSGSRSKK
jgi:DNA-binding NarL/FixJ family response regulator